MATYTSNYAWTKPGGNDQVDISVLNGNLDSQDAIMHKAFVNMAQAFSQLSTYAVGDIVLYDNDLYKCHTAVTVAGAWTGSTNWTSWTLAEGGGGGGTSDYPDLTNKPSINGVTLSGNKTTSDLGILGETSSTAYRGDRGKVAYDHSQTTGNPHGTTAADVGLGNVPNVSTNDQEPTFTEASTRNNIASGEKLSVILGKIQKFFNDLKTVAFSGSYNDLTGKPNAEDILLSDGVTSVEDAMGNMKMTKLWENSNPSINFDAQTIQLSSSNYDLLLVIARYATTLGDNVSNISSGNSGYIIFGLAGSNGPANYSRIYGVNGNQVTFGNCEMSAHNAPSKVTANNALIPYQIYGIKLT